MTSHRATLLLATVIAAMLLASLVMMSNATEDSAHFGRLYSLLLIVNTTGLVSLLILIGLNIRQLVRQYREGKPGARLTVRMVLFFTLLSVTPVTVVYYFSVQFLQRGIDSWFDVRVEQALTDALELSRNALDVRMRELLRHTRNYAAELAEHLDSPPAVILDELRERSGATEFTLLDRNGELIASSSSDATAIVPNRPTDTILTQLRQGGSYVSLDPTGSAGLHVRVVVNLPGFDLGKPSRVLLALYPMAQGTSELADSVETAFLKYKELAYLRQPLKTSFTLTLSLALAFSILTAVWAAFFSAHRLVAPIRDLAEGTRAVADGDYGTQLPVTTRDEMGFLVKSFNAMTRKIASARSEVEKSHRLAEAQRAYLEAVLGKLSSGVMTFDRGHRLRTVNAAASQILGPPLVPLLGKTVSGIAEAYEYLQPLCDVLQARQTGMVSDWREELVLFGPGGRQVLMCRGTSLAPSRRASDLGYVIVFDDITALIQAQRDAAWSEVARRLAHEIKNPLTPIKLSAERLRHKYLASMPPEDAEVLDRLTHTIIQQVDALKGMVNTFSEYARAPQIRLEPVDLNELIRDTLELYRSESFRLRLETFLEASLPRINADPARLRQILHNLLKNAIEAGEGGDPVTVEITTRCMAPENRDAIELIVEDDGPGIPRDLVHQVFEPYVTSKTKGTGLGLAVTRKILEDHGGLIRIENRETGGARIVIRLPVRGRTDGEASMTHRDAP